MSDHCFCSVLLLFLATRVHGHDCSFLIGRLSTSSLLTNILNVIEVLKHLFRRQDLHVKNVVDIELEAAYAIKLGLAVHVGLANFILELFLLIRSASGHVRWIHIGLLLDAGSRFLPTSSLFLHDQLSLVYQMPILP